MDTDTAEIKNTPEARQDTAPQPEEGGLLSYYSTLYNICQEEKINFQFLSRNWVKRLEKDGKVRFITGYKFDLNSHALGEVLDDKFALFSALEYAKVPVTEHAIFYSPSCQHNYAQGCNSLAYAHAYWLEHGRDIVMKPNNGTGGRGIFRVQSEAELAPAFWEVLRRGYSGSMCPFYKIRHEYRMILLDDEVRVSYMKTLPGAGAWKFNLQQGSQSEEIPPEKRPAIEALAKQASRAIGLRFGSVDIIKTETGELMIMEINSGVMTRKYLAQHPERYPEVKAMYRDAIRKMFAD